jgi:hypothetical protein
MANGKGRRARSLEQEAGNVVLGAKNRWRIANGESEEQKQEHGVDRGKPRVCPSN